MKSTLIIIFILLLKLPAYSSTEELLIDSIYQNRDNIIENPQFFLNRLNSIDKRLNSFDDKYYATFVILRTKAILLSTEGKVNSDQIYKATKILRYYTNDEYRYAYSLLILGYTLHRNFDNENALKYLSEAIEHCHKIKEYKLMGDIYFFIGSIKSIDIENRITHLQKAYDQYKTVNDSEYSTKILYSLVTLKEDISIEGKVFNIDSVIELSQKYKLPNIEALSYIYKAKQSRKDEDLKNYFNYILKACRLQDKLSVRNRQAVYNEYLFATIYQSPKNRNSAITKLDSILKETIGIERKSRIAWHIFKGHEINKEHKLALSYYRLYQRYNDQSIKNENERMMISSLNKYKTLEIKNELTETKLKEKTYQNTIIIILSTLIIIIILSAYRKRSLQKEKRYVKLFAAQLVQSQEELYSLLIGIPERDNTTAAEYAKFCNILKSKIKIPKKHSKILKSCKINTVKAFEIKLAITNRYPELTPDDILYCSLIYQNIENEEIGKLTNIQEASVAKRKQRLSIKMGIKPDQKLSVVIKEVVNKARKEKIVNLE